MTRADEDRFCDALREAFGDFQVVSANERRETPEVQWRSRVCDFPVAPDPPDFPYRAATVDIYFPWPNWELRGEPLYHDKWGTKEQRKASYAGHFVLTSSPLSIRID